MKCTLLAVNVAILFSCYVGAMDHLKQFLGSAAKIGLEHYIKDNVAPACNARWNRYWESADEKMDREVQCKIRRKHAIFEVARREVSRGVRSDRLERLLVTEEDRTTYQNALNSLRDNKLTDFHLVSFYPRDETKFHHDEDPEDEDPELAAAIRISLQEMQQKQLPERNQRQMVKECPVCTFEYGADRMIELSCKHNYCIACLTQIIDNALREKTTAQMLCPDPDCKRPISEQDTRTITNNNRDKFNEIAHIMTQEWIKRQPGFKQCPTTDCHYAFLNDGQSAYSMNCPSCNHQYCSGCLRAHSDRISCEQAELVRKLRDDKQATEEKATEEWKRQNSKKCPQCKTLIERDGGCLYIQCKNCHHEFCFNCLGGHHVWECGLPAVYNA